MWFHIIQVPLIGLIALAIYLLTEGLEGRAVSVSRWAKGVFAVFFSAYDAAAGIATGYALRAAQRLSAEGQAAVYEAVKDMPGWWRWSLRRRRFGAPAPLEDLSSC
jgi:hypothetical protein